MMTAPSTIRPKSSAPRLIRLALMRPCQHADRGHQHGDRDHQRGDQGRPEIAEQHEQHRDRRAGRLRSGCAPTVPMVASTSWVRSSTVSTLTPGGRDGVIASSLASTAADTVRLLAPISIRRRADHDLAGRFRWRCRCAVSPPIESVGEVADSDRHAAAGGDDDGAELPRWSRGVRRQRTTKPSPLRSM